MPVIDGLIHGGDTAWMELGYPEPQDAAHDVGNLIQAWLGRAVLLDDFLATYTIGMQYLGGYLVARRPRNDVPGMMRCDLEVMLPPDFQKSLAINSTALKTSTISASVDNSAILPKPAGFTGDDEEIRAERSVSYKAPETRYTYFASTKPEGPRFTIVASDLQPEIMRSVIRASRYGLEVPYPGAVAPAPLVSALTMPVVDVLSAHDAQPIPGTPWYACTDTITRELQGDA